LRRRAAAKGADALGKDTTVQADCPSSVKLGAALPFGADHIIMVRSNEPMPQLVGVLSALDGRKLDTTVMPGLLSLVGKSAIAIGIAGIYTQPAG